MVEDESEPFWTALNDGKLLIKLCGACGKHHSYPRPFCPHCWSGAVDWEEASGQATLYTWSVVYKNDLPPFAGRVPYVAAVVDLAEGPRMMTNVVDCEVDELRVGMPLTVMFRKETDEITLPVFRPTQ